MTKVILAGVKRTASLAAQILFRHNEMRVMATPSKNIASQAVTADDSDAEQYSGQQPENRPCSENHRVHVQQVGDTLHINLELISNDLQKELTDQLGPFLKLEPDSEVFSSVTFNYLTEDVYRNSLQRQFRKLGYDCVFARYNGARGLASFNKIEPEDVQVKRSYYRSGLPNNC